MKLLGVHFVDMTPDGYSLRAMLCETPGLLSRRAQKLADEEKRSRESKGPDTLTGKPIEAGAQGPIESVNPEDLTDVEQQALTHLARQSVIP